MEESVRSLRFIHDRHQSVIGCLLACAMLISCAKAPKTFTIGIVDDGPVNDTILESFQSGMTAQGHGGEPRVTYVYHGNTRNDADALDREIALVMGSRPDALLILGGLSLSRAANALYGKKIPMVFAPGNETLIADLIKNLRHPGANMTGVLVRPDREKIMEWILAVAPATKRIFYPFDPSRIVGRNMEMLPEAAVRFHQELLTGYPRTDEEMKAAIRSLPGDSAILIMTLFTSISGFVPLASEMRIPIFSIFPSHLEEGAVFTFTIDHDQIGRQAARLMGSVMQGISPGDIPVETAEYHASINLKAAGAIGLHVPDDALRLATRILR